MSGSNSQDPLPLPIPLPELSEDNVGFWKFSIENYAAEAGARAFIQSNLGAAPTNADKREIYEVKKGKAARIVLSTINSRMLTKLGHDVYTLNPHDIIQRAVTRLAPKQTHDNHERLLNKAQSTTMSNKHTVEEYIELHEEIRESMIAANYPGINDEIVTVTHIIRGLKTHDTLKAHIPTLMLRRPSTVDDCGSQI